MSEEQIAYAAAGGIIGSVATVGAIVYLIWYIVRFIANWKIFTKAGEAGWKSIIPFYNQYITFNLCWDTKFFWISLIVLFLSGFFSSLSTMIAGVGLLFSLISSACSIAAAVITIIMLVKLADCFGKGKGFAVGLVLLEPIFRLILGFGSAEYVGKKS